MLMVIDIRVWNGLFLLEVFEYGNLCSSAFLAHCKEPSWLSW